MGKPPIDAAELDAIEAEHVARKPGYLCKTCHRALPCESLRLVFSLRQAWAEIERLEKLRDYQELLTPDRSY